MVAAHAFRVSVLERFFATAVKHPQQPIVYCCAQVWRKKRMFSHFTHDLVQSVCTLHKHEVFALSQQVL
jgi:hypothetical protein